MQKIYDACLVSGRAGKNIVEDLESQVLVVIDIGVRDVGGDDVEKLQGLVFVRYEHLVERLVHEGHSGKVEKWEDHLSRPPKSLVH